MERFDDTDHSAQQTDERRADTDGTEHPDAAFERFDLLEASVLEDLGQVVERLALLLGDNVAVDPAGRRLLVLLHRDQRRFEVASLQLPDHGAGDPQSAGNQTAQRPQTLADDRDDDHRHYDQGVGDQRPLADHIKYA